MILVEEQARELLVSSSILDATPVYASGTYDLGDVVQYEDYIYKSVAASNTEPPTNGEKWVNWDNVKDRAFPVGFPINKYRCMDDYSTETMSTQAGNMTIILNNNLCTFLGLYGIIADSIQVTMYDESGAIVFTETTTTEADPLWDYVDYYYWEDVDKILSKEYELPRHITGTTKIQLLGTNTVLGTLEYGSLKQLGCTLTNNTSFEYTGLEKASVDTSTGIAYYKEAIRGGTGTISAQVKINGKKELNQFSTILHKYTGKVITFLVDDREKDIIPVDMFRIRGKVTRFETSLSNQKHRYNMSIDAI